MLKNKDLGTFILFTKATMLYAELIIFHWNYTTLRSRYNLFYGLFLVLCQVLRSMALQNLYCLVNAALNFRLDWLSLKLLVILLAFFVVFTAWSKWEDISAKVMSILRKEMKQYKSHSLVEQHNLNNTRKKLIESDM